MGGHSSDLIAGVLGVVSIAISALAGLAAKRSAAKAQSRDTQVTSRTDIEKAAFERAESFYKGAMDRQDAEIARQDREITQCHVELEAVKNRVADLEDELATARRALRLRYPDE